MRWDRLAAELGASPPGPLFPLARSDEGEPTSPVGSRGLQQLLLSTPSARLVRVAPGTDRVAQLAAAVVRQRRWRVLGNQRGFALAVPGALVPLLEGLHGVEWRLSELPHSLTSLATAQGIEAELAALEGHPELAGAETGWLATIADAHRTGIDALRDGTIEREWLDIDPWDGRFGFKVRVRHDQGLVLAGGLVFLRDAAGDESALPSTRGPIPKLVQGWERDAGLRVSHGDLAVPLGSQGVFDLEDAQALAIELRTEELVELVLRLLDRWLTHTKHRGMRRRLRNLLGL
jgi:hypothetical protein